MNKVKFAQQEAKRKIELLAKTVIATLTNVPIYTYNSVEINNSKFPDKMCVLCQQRGCDSVVKGNYAHDKCLAFLRVEVKKA
jgi:hypothetical protein